MARRQHTPFITIRFKPIGSFTSDGGVLYGECQGWDQQQVDVGVD